MRKLGHLIVAMGLNPQAPYSLGNKDYYYKRECNSGHTNLKDEDIQLTGGTNDGYRWTVPVCMICIRADKDYPMVRQHSHNKRVYLKSVDLRDEVDVIKITDSKDNRRLGNEQKASKEWMKKYVTSKDCELLLNGEQIGVTVRKGRGFSHVTLKAKLKDEESV